jgi:hypothetical protein
VTNLDEKVQQLFTRLGFELPLPPDQFAPALAGTLILFDPDFAFERRDKLARQRNAVRIAELLRLTDVAERPRRLLERQIEEFEAVNARAAKYRKRFEAGSSGTEHDCNWPVTLEDVLAAEGEVRQLRDDAEAAKAKLASLQPQKTDSQHVRELTSALKKSFAKAADAACQIYREQLRTTTAPPSNAFKTCHERASLAAAEAFAEIVPSDGGAFVYEVLLDVEDEANEKFDGGEYSDIIADLKDLFTATLERALPIKGLASVYSRWRKLAEAGEVGSFPLAPLVEDYLLLVQHHRDVTDAIKRNIDLGR